LTNDPTSATPSRWAIAAYLALCVGFVAIGLQITLRSWPSTLTSRGIERAYFQSLIARHEADYLLKLRDTHLGCETIAYRDPEIVFLGDSHSYAGWDYPVLQDRLRPMRVGNCALAGMFPENIADFAALVATAGLSTKYVVFGIQPRMFWDVPERPDRVTRARRMMAEAREPRENLPTMITGRWRQIDPFIGSAMTEPQKIARLDSEAKSLDGATVDRTLAGNEQTIYALNFWLGYVNEGGPLHDVPALVQRACDAVRATGLRLAVVYIPESRWLNEHYSAAQRRDFMHNAMLYRQCADWIDMSAFESMGYDNRFFINRYLVDNYPYAGWQRVSIAHQWMAENATERRWQFFDPDHMSAAGAREFSARIAPRLAAWTSRSSGGPQ
jgi:hypothetical protein